MHIYYELTEHELIQKSQWADPNLPCMLPFSIMPTIERTQPVETYINLHGCQPNVTVYHAHRQCIEAVAIHLPHKIVEQHKSTDTDTD